MTIVEETLEAWRDAERLLERLPPLDPDHESVALAVGSLRDTYKTLTAGASERTPALLARSRTSIDRSRALLDRVHGKLERNRDGA
ncbi:MAG TPA: hypothetical protein VFM38_14300 [Candidatus Limnocylindrales bacterium]|nr:hypothetical protein [Candidatus Limnocylindrales bacterium]